VQFYRNYHSLRYSNDNLILRIKHAPNDAELSQLRVEFADILTSGTFELQSAQDCRDDAILPETPRLTCIFNRRSLARLRLLIDQLNTLPSLPPVKPPESAAVGSKESVRGVAEIAEEEGITLAGAGLKPSSRPAK
jgi:hypothetical protein